MSNIIGKTLIELKKSIENELSMTMEIHGVDPQITYCSHNFEELDFGLYKGKLTVYDDNGNKYIYPGTIECGRTLYDATMVKYVQFNNQLLGNNILLVNVINNNTSLIQLICYKDFRYPKVNILGKNNIIYQEGYKDGLQNNFNPTLETRANIFAMLDYRRGYEAGEINNSDEEEDNETPMDPHDQGFECGSSDDTYGVTSNPYEEGTQDYEDWNTGYEDGWAVNPNNSDEEEDNETPMDPHDQGFECGSSDIIYEETSNPYEEGTQDYEDWNTGYEEGWLDNPNNPDNDETNNETDDNEE